MQSIKIKNIKIAEYENKICKRKYTIFLYPLFKLRYFEGRFEISMLKLFFSGMDTPLKHHYCYLYFWACLVRIDFTLDILHWVYSN